MLIVRPNSITSISESSGPNGWESRGANGRGTFSRSVFFLSSARSRIVADHRPLPFLQSQHQLRSSHPTQPSRSEEGEPSPESTSTRLQSCLETNRTRSHSPSSTIQIHKMLLRPSEELPVEWRFALSAFFLKTHDTSNLLRSCLPSSIDDACTLILA